MNKLIDVIYKKTTWTDDSQEIVSEVARRIPLYTLIRNHTDFGYYIEWGGTLASLGAINSYFSLGNNQHNLFWKQFTLTQSEYEQVCDYFATMTNGFCRAIPELAQISDWDKWKDAYHSNEQYKHYVGATWLLPAPYKWNGQPFDLDRLFNFFEKNHLGGKVCDPDCCSTDAWDFGYEAVRNHVSIQTAYRDLPALKRAIAELRSLDDSIEGINSPQHNNAYTTVPDLIEKLEGLVISLKRLIANGTSVIT